LSQKGIFWVVVVCAPLGCATAVDYVEEDTGPAPKKDSGAMIDSGHDTGVIKPDSGVDEDTGVQQDSGSMACMRTIEYGTAMCDTCMENSCCKEDNACGNSQACGDFIQCVDDCFNDGGNPNQCMTDCQTKYPQGANLFTAVDNCLQQSCGNNCR
jgi:hypothetical protein